MHYDNYNLHCVISIHALLAESDDASKDIIKTIINFYPRSPCGERPGLIFFFALCIIISIHALLAESDTSNADTKNTSLNISIHALLAESD